MTTHLDILEELLSRSHDTDCPLYKHHLAKQLDFCSCKVRPEVERLRRGLVPWVEVKP